MTIDNFDNATSNTSHDEHDAIEKIVGGLFYFDPVWSAGDLHQAVAEVFGNDDLIITKLLTPEGRAAVRARVPWASDDEISSVYRFRDKYEMVILCATAEKATDGEASP